MKTALMHYYELLATGTLLSVILVALGLGRMFDIGAIDFILACIGIFTIGNLVWLFMRLSNLSNHYVCAQHVFVIIFAGVNTMAYLLLVEKPEIALPVLILRSIGLITIINTIRITVMVKKAFA